MRMKLIYSSVVVVLVGAFALADAGYTFTRPGDAPNDKKNTGFGSSKKKSAGYVIGLPADAKPAKRGSGNSSSFVLHGGGGTPVASGGGASFHFSVPGSTKPGCPPASSGIRRKG